MTGEEPPSGLDGPASSWPEYDQLREAVEAYLDHNPPEPEYRDIWRALGAILGEYQRARFVRAFGVDTPAEQPCIARLITGATECPHGSDTGDGDLPPHEPPARDHATLWLDGGQAAVYSMHIYPGNIEPADSDRLRRSLWFDLVAFADRWGLELSVLPRSWYNPESTVHVVLYPPERYRLFP